MFDGPDGVRSFREIAQMMGVSHTYIRRTHGLAIRKMQLTAELLEAGMEPEEIAFVLLAIPEEALIKPCVGEAYAKAQDKLPADERTACKKYDRMFGRKREAMWNFVDTRYRPSTRFTNTSGKNPTTPAS